MPIRVDCYLSVKNRFESKFPNAHFENVTRSFGSVLSPSYELLHKFKIGEIDINKFFRLLVDELKDNPQAIKRIQDLRELSKTKLVFLVCFEKDFNKCHRYLLRKIIDEGIL